MNGFALRLKGRRPLLFAALLTACALLCLALLTGRAFADAETPTITYDGAARQLTVQGAQGSATATDLFPAFKNLMPGDKRQQDVAVRVSGVDSEVRVYAKAVVDDETAQALEPITLSASVSGDGGEMALDEGSAGSVFSDSVCIAKFTADGQATLHLQLQVPVSVSNELASANEQVRWEITAEDDSGTIEPTTPAPSGGVSAGAGLASHLTQTGDNLAAVVALLVGIAAAAVALSAFAVFCIRRKR